ncbi:MAG: DUF3099 domain-containing protein [Actinomycetes bacterium]
MTQGTRGSAGGSRQEPVYTITETPRGTTERVRSRTRRYLVSMGIRTACFVLLVVTPSPWRWAFLAGAVVLPYLAVVVANAGRESRRDLPIALARQRSVQLGGSGCTTAPVAEHTPSAGRDEGAGAEKIVAPRD